FEVISKSYVSEPEEHSPELFNPAARGKPQFSRGPGACDLALSLFSMQNQRFSFSAGETTEACIFLTCFGRADWFLLDSRTVRHAAIGLFCCGVSVYLTALAIYMLLLFELEAGIASACILSSGIIVLLITVTHALVRASQVSRRGRSEVSHTLYENDSAQHGESSTSDLNNKNVAEPRPRPEIHREFSFPPFLERKSQLGSPASSNLTSSGSPGLRSEQESYNPPRTHRTLSAQGKPWHGVTQEMRNVLSRKPGASGKDSTLV
uniref:Transmembrane protein 221 n=1 Tax=Bubo bubo TaxID=30461 RepID=A0A8C0FEU3_BUBBB